MNIELLDNEIAEIKNAIDEGIVILEGILRCINEQLAKNKGNYGVEHRKTLKQAKRKIAVEGKISALESVYKKIIEKER